MTLGFITLESCSDQYKIRDAMIYTVKQQRLPSFCFLSFLLPSSSSEITKIHFSINKHARKQSKERTNEWTNECFF